MVICISLDIADRSENSRFLKAIAAVGQMSLTVYLTHIMVGLLFLEVLYRLGRRYYLFPVYGPMAYYAGTLVFCRWYKQRSSMRSRE